MTEEERQQILNNDDGSCVVIREPVKLTAYDKKLAALRDLEAKRERLLAVPDPTDADRRMLVSLGPLIEDAQKCFDDEKKRGIDDAWRRRRAIDDWRAGEGNDEYKASRRTVRAKPNADLSGWTADEKEQRKKEQRSDNNWIKRQQAKGWAEAQIQAGLVIRAEKRKVEREADRKAVDDRAEMEQLPTFGEF